MGLLKRIVDRRAAKGGKIVTWWRKTFGTGAADVLEDAALDMLNDSGRVQQGRMALTDYIRKYGNDAPLPTMSSHPKEIAEEYVKELERTGRIKR